MPTTTVEDLRIPERVARGVAWLDEHVRGWWLPGRIDLDELVMVSTCNCILGQLYGGEYYKAPIHMDTAVECGFDTRAIYEGTDYYEAAAVAAAEADAEFEALAAEWTRVILERRGAPQ